MNMGRRLLTRAARKLLLSRNRQNDGGPWRRVRLASTPNLDSSCGAVPLDRAGRPRPALVRN
jgi:hypothetical protein